MLVEQRSTNFVRAVPTLINVSQEGAAAEFGPAFVARAASGDSAGQSETLYVELRRGKETLDPADWFVMNPVVGQAEQVRTSE